MCILIVDHQLNRMHPWRKVQPWQKVSHLLEQENRVVTRSNG